MKRIIMTILLIVVGFTAYPVSAAQLDPQTGVLTHTFVDRESDVYIGMLTVGNTAYAISFLNDYGTLPVESFMTDVYTITTDTVDFIQSGVMYHASIFDPMEYTGTLSDRYLITYEDDSQCMLFHLTLQETNERLTVCVNPKNAPSNGAVAVNFAANTLAQDKDGSNHRYNFMVTEDTIPAQHVIHLPFIAR